MHLCLHPHAFCCVCVFQLDLSAEEVSLMNQGACGAFIHALEDEHKGTYIHTWMQPSPLVGMLVHWWNISDPAYFICLTVSTYFSLCLLCNDPFHCPYLAYYSTCTHTHSHTHTHTHTYVYTCTHTHTHTHTDTHSLTPTCIHTHTHPLITHTHTCTHYTYAFFRGAFGGFRIHVKASREKQEVWHPVCGLSDRHVQWWNWRCQVCGVAWNMPSVSVVFSLLICLVYTLYMYCMPVPLYGIFL